MTAKCNCGTCLAVAFAVALASLSLAAGPSVPVTTSFYGKVTEIKGDVITIIGQNQAKRVFQIVNTPGIQIGAIAI